MSIPLRDKLKHAGVGAGLGFASYVVADSYTALPAGLVAWATCLSAELLKEALDWFAWNRRDLVDALLDVVATMAGGLVGSVAGFGFCVWLAKVPA